MGKEEDSMAMEQVLRRQGEAGARSSPLFISTFTTAVSTELRLRNWSLSPPA